MCFALDILYGQRCQYCEAPTELVDSMTLYGKEYGGLFYRCAPCDAHVGCHPGTKDALGTVANAELRLLRNVCHKVFDPLWRARISRRCGKARARTKGYAWLSQSLGIDQHLTHIGMMDESTCERVIELCRPYYEKLISRHNQ